MRGWVDGVEWLRMDGGRVVGWVCLDWKESGWRGRPMGLVVLSGCGSGSVWVVGLGYSDRCRWD